MLWVILSFISAVTLAGVVLASDLIKLPTVARLFWVRLITFLAAIGFAFSIQWPQDIVFYQCMLGLSVLIGISDIMYYGAARDLGAGVVTRTEPLSVLLTFIAWTALTPSLLNTYMSDPLHAVGIIACFAVATYCALHMRHCAVGFAALKRLAPVVVMMVGVTILAKIGMDRGGDPQDAIIAYLVVQSALMVLFYGVMAVVKPSYTGSIKPTRALLKGAGIMAVFSIGHIATKNVAFMMVPNPAYVTIIILAAPLFVTLFDKLIGREDDADIKAGLGIVASAVVLIILTKV